MLGDIQKFADGVAALTAAGDRLADSTAKMERYGIAIKGNQAAIRDMTQSLDALVSITGKVGKAIGKTFSLLGGDDSVLGGMGQMIEAASGGLDKLSGFAQDSAKALGEMFDAPSREIRALDGFVFGLNKRFVGTIDAAREFSDALVASSGNEFARSLYITRGNLREMADAASNTQLTLDQMNQSVSTSLGETTLLGSAYAFASASGMDSRTTMSLLNTIINKQGVEVSEATKVLGVYAGTSQATGLSIDKVASSLNSAVSGFSKLGASADFGRPVLEGFSRVVRDMGLGIEEADGLARTFSASLLNLATDYSGAFVVQQRSGRDFGGGGGALGASIGLQAEILDAEKTGDQSRVASELASAMKDTIASFGGGNIVTVGDAAQSPELQTQFYTQQQLLMNQFGIRDQGSANRTLEYLQGLEKATREGDISGQRHFEELINNEKQGRDELLDSQQKIIVELRRQTDLLMLENRDALMAQFEAGSALAQNIVMPGVVNAGEKAREMFGDGADEVAYFFQDMARRAGAMDNPADIAALQEQLSGQGAAMREADTRALDVADMRRRIGRHSPEEIISMLNEAQAQDKNDVESLNELIDMVSTGEFGMNEIADDKKDEFREAMIETLKEISANQTIDVRVTVGDSGQLQAMANVVKQVAEKQ